MLTIPSQNKVTQQIISLWQPFKDLKQAFAVSRRAEQLRLRSQQRIIATAEDLSFGQRWPTSSLRKRMPVDVCYGSSP